MASGLGVVATDDALRREIVGNAGFFVKKPGDATEYSTQLAQALVKNFGQRPITQAKRFSWDIIARSYESAFTTLLDS